jgi:hypothetical protein
MTNQQHSITPPPELVQQWRHSWLPSHGEFVDYMITQAAQWGADQELEACIEWIAGRDWTWTSAQLRTARRPKPPSLKEQALQVLASAPGPDYPRVMTVLNADEHALIRQALEALPND